MNKKNQIISLLLTILLVLGLAGCGQTQKAEPVELDAVLQETAEMLIEANPNPGCGSIGGEWSVFALSRWGGGIPEGAWFDTYYANLEEYVKECEGVLDARKYTEYSRVILALTALGKDPANVAGYNLLEPLADFDATIFQGINGPAYALLALDSGNYDIPAVKGDGTQATRDMYVDYILSKEIQGGGWSLSGAGAAEADLTAMALQALAKYQSREDVQAAVERGVNVLAEMQSEDGGYESFGAASSESFAQAILALSELGIPMDDERFVKDGKTLVDRLLEYRADDGGFKHTLDGGSDMLATEQAFYALVGCDLAQQGMSIFAIRPVV